MLSKILSTLTSSFSTYISFISISFLIALAKTSSTMLNRSGESGLPATCLNLWDCFKFFFCLTWWWLWLSQIIFVVLRYVPSISSLTRVFYHESILKFVKGFLLHRLKYSWDLCLWIQKCGELHFLIYVCQTSPASLEWSQRNHGETYFVCF